MASTETARASAGVKVAPAVYHIACLLCGFAFDLVFDVEPALPRWAKLAGGLLIMTGVGIVAAGLGTLWRSGTTVDPAKGATALVVSGPYRVSRNPAYLGWSFIYLGVAVSGGSLAALILLPLAMAGVQHFAIRREEAHLQQVFGEAYERYRARVPRWL